MSRDAALLILVGIHAFLSWFASVQVVGLLRDILEAVS